MGISSQPNGPSQSTGPGQLRPRNHGHRLAICPLAPELNQVTRKSRTTCSCGRGTGHGTLPPAVRGLARGSQRLKYPETGGRKKMQADRRARSHGNVDRNVFWPQPESGTGLLAHEVNASGSRAGTRSSQELRRLGLHPSQSVCQPPHLAHGAQVAHPGPQLMGGSSFPSTRVVLRQKWKSLQFSGWRHVPWAMSRGPRHTSCPGERGKEGVWATGRIPDLATKGEWQGRRPTCCLHTAARASQLPVCHKRLYESRHRMKAKL